MKLIQVSSELVCNLPEPDLVKRRAALSDEVFSAVTASSEIDDGYAFEFRGDEKWARTLFELVMFERMCCRFMRLELDFAPENTKITLRIRGTGVKEFLGSELEGIGLPI